jgi:hypothetical protein
MKWLADEAAERNLDRTKPNWKKTAPRRALDFNLEQWTIITDFTTHEQMLITKTTGPNQAITDSVTYIPQQTDGFNCGIYVCLMTMFLHHGIPLQKVAEIDPNRYRVKLAGYILDGRLPAPHVERQPINLVDNPTDDTMDQDGHKVAEQGQVKCITLVPSRPGLQAHQIKGNNPIPRLRGSDGGPEIGRIHDAVLVALLGAMDKPSLQRAFTTMFLITAWHWGLGGLGPKDKRYQTLIQHLGAHAGKNI